MDHDACLNIMESVQAETGIGQLRVRYFPSSIRNTPVDEAIQPIVLAVARMLCCVVPRNLGIQQARYWKD